MLSLFKITNVSSLAGAKEELNNAVVEMFVNTFKEMKKENVDEDECLLQMKALSLHLRNKANRVVAVKKDVLAM